jgi:hypothetical protein
MRDDMYINVFPGFSSRGLMRKGKEKKWWAGWSGRVVREKGEREMG